MVIVQNKGISNVFLTFIYNPNWQEIVMEFKPNQIASDCPDLVAHVFQMMVKAFLKGVAKIGWFANVIGNIWIREYQKRGLLHIHLLLIFPLEQKVSTTEDINCLVSMQLPLPKNAPFFETICCIDRAAKNTPMHHAWSMMYVRNVICEFFLRRQHKVKMVTLSIVDKMMVKCFKKL